MHDQIWQWTNGIGWRGAYALNNALLALWLEVFGEDAYVDDTWGHIVGIQIRFIDDHLSGILLLVGQENGIVGYKSRCCWKMLMV